MRKVHGPLSPNSIKSYIFVFTLYNTMPIIPLRAILFTLASSLVVFAVQAQPTWRFHLAFEDGTGARDTIWFVYDTTATEGSTTHEVDTALDEGAVAIALDEFNVWIYNWNFDSTKTIAYPYTEFPLHGAEINAFNYMFPITLTWDTALFHAPGLPTPGYLPGGQMLCDYFFWHNNDWLLQAYDMTLDDSVTVVYEEPFTILFPLTVNIGTVNTASITAVPMPPVLSIHPNPASSSIKVMSDRHIQHLSIMDAQGRTCMAVNGSPDEMTIDVTPLSPGPYLIQVQTRHDSWIRKRFIKL